MDLVLNRYLQDNLDMRVVRCVGHSDALLLIKGIQYSAILLDATDKKLELSIRKVRNHMETPVIIAYGSHENIAKKVKRSITTA